MNKWKCTMCWKDATSESKPQLIERVCGSCKVSAYTKLVKVYEEQGGFRLDEARMLLRKAQKEAKA